MSTQETLTRNRVIATMLAGLVLACSGGTVRAAAQTKLVPSFSDVAVGDVFEIVLTGLGFDQTLDGKTIGNVTGGQNLNFSFSQGTLEVLGVAIAPRWTFAAGNRPGTIDNSAGTVSGTAFGTFPATTDDDFDIVTFTVKALAPGSANMALTSAQFIGQVDGRAGQLISASLAQTSVNVVPEPGQWALLLAGLTFVGLKLRRS